MKKELNFLKFPGLKHFIDELKFSYSNCSSLITLHFFQREIYITENVVSFHEEVQK